VKRSPGEKVPGVDGGFDLVDPVVARGVQVLRVGLGGQPGERGGGSWCSGGVDLSMKTRGPILEDAPGNLQEERVEAVLGAVVDAALVVVVGQVRDPFPEVNRSGAVVGGLHAIAPVRAEGNAQAFHGVLKLRQVEDVQRGVALPDGAPGDRLLGREEVKLREQRLRI
jgi:hypothetical protein